MNKGKKKIVVSPDQIKIPERGHFITISDSRSIISETIEVTFYHDGKQITRESYSRIIDVKRRIDTILRSVS